MFRYTFYGENNCNFDIDLEKFLSGLTEVKQTVFIKRLEGFTLSWITDIANLSISTVNNKLLRIGKDFVKCFDINRAERFGLV